MAADGDTKIIMKLAPLHERRESQAPITDWEEDCDRFVGFMDIMGFKDLVARKPHEEIKHYLLQMNQTRSILLDLIGTSFDKETGEETKDARVRSFTFSDSIVFITKGNSIKDLFDLSVAIVICQEASIQSGGPTKGAISFGKLTANFEKSIFFGQPIIDAYLLQEELFYYGVILDNNAEAILKDAIQRKDPALKYNHFVRLPTPLKSGKINHFNLQMKNLFDDQMEYLYNSIAGHARKYVDNTIEMYQLMNAVDKPKKGKQKNKPNINLSE